jgi:hypothetical protein
MLAAICIAPDFGSAQERLSGADRRVLRLNAGFPVEPNGQQLHFGLEGDFGLTGQTSIVAAARRWGYGNFGCLFPGPIQDESGETVETTDAGYACTPDGWSISGGLRGALTIGRGRAAVYAVMGEVDIGLYRYDLEQPFVMPYGGVRAGLAATFLSAFELQLTRHLIMVSSYDHSGFDPNTWQLGSWDVGLGIPW